MSAELTIVGYLRASHTICCAVNDPVPDSCDCGAVSVPLVRLADAQRAIEAARTPSAPVAPQEAAPTVTNSTNN